MPPPESTPGGEHVFNVTAAQRALSDEQSGRTRRYLVSMAIRTACVIAAIFVPGWPRWVLIAGAVVLPYLAVVVANAGRENDEPGELGVAPAPLASLPSAGASVITGVVHDPLRGPAQ
ncbi:MAG: DUF3099 domain-containing protein [Candidatus Nanopelagicales bacterium]|nr:DUF3099 domain-containing protein [Candidatus Nanopelagicales bacterium]